MTYKTIEQANREAAQREAKRNPPASDMSLRDYFAAKAMQELVGVATPVAAASMAYGFADEMLKARQA